MTDEPKLRRVVTYERVSSEDQRERATIKTQTEELARRLGQEPGARLVGRYPDDGVSGTIPFAKRPAGRRLLEDAAKGQFDEIWVYKLDRLGRDDIDPLIVRRDLEALGVTVNSVVEGHPDQFTYAIHIAVAAQERRTLLDRTVAGMNRAAREGRYLGGIVPLGYRVEGAKQNARLVPSDIPMWGELTEADVARQIFQRLVEGDSCTRIAVEFNALGVPTAYGKDGRGIRGKRTQEVWRPNRIYSLATNTIYRGEQRYGEHSKKPGREVISAPAPRLVSDEVWYAAQETLHGHRVIPDGKRTVYLLRKVMRCMHCGQGYYGATGGDRPGSYRCGGQLVARRLEHGRCIGKSIRCDVIDAIVWGDIERFLRDPGEVIHELEKEASKASGETAVADAERVLWSGRLQEIGEERRRALDLHVRGRMTDVELDTTLDRIQEERHVVEQRLQAFGTDASRRSPITPDLLSEIRARLDAGLTIEQRQEIVQRLVAGITIDTEVINERTKVATARIGYLFPSVVPSHTASRCRRCRPSRRCPLTRAT